MLLLLQVLACQTNQVYPRSEGSNLLRAFSVDYFPCNHCKNNSYAVSMRELKEQGFTDPRLSAYYLDGRSLALVIIFLCRNHILFLYV